MAVIRSPDTLDKLAILSQDSQLDLACACGTRTNDDHRQRSREGTWLYPVSLPNGGQSVLLKTLLSNVCTNDCAYCPLRAERDIRRCTLEPEALVESFLRYYRSGQAMGLFLSSGVTGDPDRTMERINAVARILRHKEEFRGYIHLKVIPGASDAAIENSVCLASTVSVNIETPGETHFARLCQSKRYLEDVIRPIKLVRELTQKGSPHARVRQTTQFIVGASDETDQEIVRYTWGLYRRLDLQRVYFSAYQQGAGRPELPGERAGVTGNDLLTREHRLYQVDFLLRRYGFEASEIPFEPGGNLSLGVDPKEHWARQHPECFPVDLNRADRRELLRVPGLGPVTVNRILALRRGGGRIAGLEDLGRVGKRLARARAYVKV
ncbi:MAG: radical SAM protein [Candidatus Latescibacterota bacterium]